jgi:hypothetical protein
MSGSGQFDDLTTEVVPFPLHREGISSLDAFKERVRPHNPRDTERPKIVREIKEAMSQLKPADILADIYGAFKFGLSKPHDRTLPRSNTERFESAPQKLNRGNTVTKVTRFNHVDFRRAVVPQPQSDNAGWHPLDAA